MKISLDLEGGLCWRWMRRPPEETPAFSWAAALSSSTVSAAHGALVSLKPRRLILTLKVHHSYVFHSPSRHADALIPGTRSTRDVRIPLLIRSLYFLGAPSGVCLFEALTLTQVFLAVLGVGWTPSDGCIVFGELQLDSPPAS